MLLPRTGKIPGFSEIKRESRPNPFERSRLRVVPDEDRTRQRLPEGVDLRLFILDGHHTVQGPHLPDTQPPPWNEVAISQVVEYRSVLVPDLGDTNPLIRDSLTQSKGFLYFESALGRGDRVPVWVVIRMPQ